MNSKDLRNYRKNFYIILEEFIKENGRLTIEDYYYILGKNIHNCKTSIENSKKVLVYIGSYMKNEDEKNVDLLTYDNNSKAIYKLYKDIESGALFKVLIKNVKKFEKTYKIIYPKVDIYNVQEYNKKFERIKFEYYKNLLYQGQKSSYKLIKKINEQKYY